MNQPLMYVWDKNMFGFGEHTRVQISHEIETRKHNEPIP